MADVMNSKVTPAQRAANFNQLTRKNIQTLATKTGAESGVVSFELPKARLLAGVKVLVKATLTATHSSSTSYTAHEDSPFKFLRRVEMNMNNGFAPYSVSGYALAMDNATKYGISALTAKTSGRGKVVQGLTASSTGTANTVQFILDLKNQLNDRDPIGLILLQNDETLVTVTATLGTKDDLAPAASGYTFAISDISVSLLTETFTIPNAPEAFPDISVLKLVQERTESVVVGENIFKLPVGQTYRKLYFILYSATPARQADSIITSTIDLIFNQSEIPYRVKPVDLAAINATAYKGDLPTGVYCFDFSDNGTPDLGSARDYVDTERLTEFWMRFTASAAGSVKIFAETLSRLG